MVKLTKSYLRYEPAGQFGTIASPNCNCLLSGDGKYVFSAANEFVVCWSLRRNEAVFQFSPSSNFLGNGGQSSTTSSGKSKTSSSSDKQLASAAASGDAAVTRLAWLNDRPGATMLVGHTDGTLRIWDFSLNTKAEIDKGFDVFDLKPPALRQVLHGHKAAITTIGCVSSPPPQSVASSSSAEASEQLVATGSADTDIVLWDVLGERGVCRLRGHRDRVTGLQFVAGPLTPLGKGRLLSVSKDKTLKLWELETQICLQTVAERVELWSCLYWQGTSSGGGAGAASTSAARVVVGGTDHLLRVYSVNAEETEDVDRLQQIGTLQREIANAAAVELLRASFPDGQNAIVCQSANKALEFFRIHSDQETKRRSKRRKKRAEEKRKKKSKKDGAGGPSAVGDPQDGGVSAEAEPKKHEDEDGAGPDEDGAGGADGSQATDEFCRLPAYRLKAKIHGIAVCGDKVACALGSNALEVFDVQLPEIGGEEKPVEISDARAVERHGHRNAVRAVTISSDDNMLASTSAEAIKIWNAKTRNCTQTIPSGYGLCISFLPGNQHVVIGTKSGDLELYSLAGGELVQKFENAHSNAPEDGSSTASAGKEIYTLTFAPDKTWLATGGADKAVRFWHIVKDAKGGSGLSLNKGRKVVDNREGAEEGASSGKSKSQKSKVLERLSVPDDVLCLTTTPQFLCVGMLDSCCSLYFLDSLKFSLSLYGHKLPILAVDASSDGELVATGSADKNIKLWNSRFGNNLRSLRAHDDSVMDVKFVRLTHYLVSVSKDKSVKLWDCDTYSLITTLGHHLGEIWSAALSFDAAFITTVGSDRALRVFKRTNEQFFAEEEREKELEIQLEKDAVRGDDFLSNNDAVVEFNRPTRQNIESVRTADRLLEILEQADQMVGLGVAKTRETFVLKFVNGIDHGLLYEVLVALPFVPALAVLESVGRVVEAVTANTGSLSDLSLSLLLSERVWRVVLILIHAHSRRLGESYASLLLVLRDGLRRAAGREREGFGVVRAAMGFMIAENNQGGMIDFLAEAEAESSSGAQKPQKGGGGAGNGGSNKRKAGDGDAGGNEGSNKRRAGDGGSGGGKKKAKK